MFKGNMPLRERIYKQIIPQSLGMILSPAVFLVVINMLTNTAAKAVEGFTGKEEVSFKWMLGPMMREAWLLAALISGYFDFTWNTVFKATNQFKTSRKKEAITTLLTYLGTAFAATVSASTVMTQAELTAPIIKRLLELNIALLALSSLAANAPAAAESLAKLVNNLTHFLLGNPPATAVDYLAAVNKAFLNDLLQNPQNMEQIMANIKNIPSAEALTKYLATLPNNINMQAKIDAQIEALKKDPNSIIYGTDFVRLRDGKLEYRINNQACTTFKEVKEALVDKKRETPRPDEGTSLLSNQV